MRRPLTLLALACACALPAEAAVAAPHGPGKGRVWHSGIGGYGAGAVDVFAADVPRRFVGLAPEFARP